MLWYLLTTEPYNAQMEVNLKLASLVVFVVKGLVCVVFQAVAYFIHVLDKIVNRDYVIVYLHTLSSEENQPPLSFLKDIYHLVDIKLVSFATGFCSLYCHD